MIKKIIFLSPNYGINSETKDKYSKLSKDNPPEILEVFDKNIDGRIRIYEDRIKGWSLNFARKLINERDAGFIILLICISYLEGNQQIREGKKSEIGETGKFIKNALERIFKLDKEKMTEDQRKLLNKGIDSIIKEVRNGLFHDGFTRKGVELCEDPDILGSLSIHPKDDRIIIKPSLFLKRIEKDFEEHINVLKNKDNKTERENFEKYWKENYGT